METEGEEEKKMIKYDLLTHWSTLQVEKQYILISDFM